jgi:hypothetical protein
MGCSKPVIHKVKCNICGEEICRINKTVTTNLREALIDGAIAYKGAEFSAFVANFFCTTECFGHTKVEDLIIVSEPLQMKDLINIHSQMNIVLIETMSCANATNALRKYIEILKLNENGFNRLYKNIIDNMIKLQELVRQKASLEWQKEEVPDTVRYCLDK